MGRITKTLGNASVYAVGLLLNRGIAYVLVAVYTRVFPKSEVAAYDLCVATLLFLVPFFELGMAATIGRFFHHYDREEDRNCLFSTDIAFVLASISVGIALVAAFSTGLSRLIFQDDRHSTLVILVAMQTAMFALASQPLAWLRTQERSVTFAILNVVQGATGPSCIIVFVVWLKMGVFGVVLGDTLGLAAVAITGLLVCRKSLRWTMSAKMLRAMLRFGLPLLPLGFAGTILTSSDRYFLMKWTGADALAVYAIGAKIGILMQFMNQAIQTAYPPAAFQIAKEPDAKAVFAQLLRLQFVAMFLLALGLTAFGKELLMAFATSQYRDAYVIIPFIAFSYAFYGAGLNVLTGLSIVHKTAFVSVSACVAAALKLALNYVLIGPFGIYGAAVATLLAFAVQFALACYFTRREYPVPYEWRKIVGLCALAALFALVLLLLTPLGYPQGLAFRAAAFAGFAAFAILGFVTAEERSKGIGLVKRLSKRLPV